jgi:hypothetical protein
MATFNPDHSWKKVEPVVFFNRGETLEALQASASCGFILGAMAMGLAAARVFGRR